jgi:heptosyltransferase-2
MKKILVIAPQYIGDTILVIPFLRNLRNRYKEDIIDIVTKNAGLLILKECPYIDNIYKEEELKKNFYDKAYVIKRSLSAALLAKKLKIKETIGFGGQFRELLLTKSVKYLPKIKHEIECFFDILQQDGTQIVSKNLEYWTEKESIENIKHYLGDKNALIVTSSTSFAKNWEIEKFNQVIEYLNKKGYKCFIVGTDKEFEYNQNFQEVTNLSGKITFKEIIALISKVDLVFGVDSGFCHMGAAFNKKVLTLFGSTSIKQWKILAPNAISYSLNLSCSPCRKAKKCNKNFKCMKMISVEEVIQTLENTLKIE